MGNELKIETMKNLVIIAIGLLAFIIFFACQNNDDFDRENATNPYKIGKNRFTIDLNGDTREYYVHVPTNYDENIKTPVVFMLHGTSGNGNKFYHISGWKEVGEEENIITVYPSSWKHRIIDRGQLKNTTKWNVYPGSFTYQSGETPKDDINFLKEIINKLHQKFNVDSKRIYLVGFSNGGAMAFRCAVEMSDILAAVVEASGTIQVDTLVNPKRNLPILWQTGNSDDVFLGNKPDVPLTSIDSLLNSSGLLPMMNTHLNSFNLDSSYILSNEPGIAYARYNPLIITTERYMLFALIENLEHQYPNGINHPLKGAEVHWEWLKQFTLP